MNKLTQLLFKADLCVAKADALLRCDGDWDESKHPRAQDGKFGEGSATKPEFGKNKKANLDMAKAYLEQLGYKAEIYTGKSQSRSAAVWSHGVIYLYQSSKVWSDPVGAMKEQADHKFLASADPVHILHHEIGHELYDAPSNFMNNAERDIITQHVSKYAAMNPKEFVSEVHAAMAAGKTYPPEIMHLFKRYAVPRGSRRFDSFGADHGQ